MTTRPLDSVCIHLPGKYLAKAEYARGGPYRVHGSNSIMGSHSSFLYSGPMTVLARIGSKCGALAWEPNPAWINNNASALRAREDIDPRWLHMLLSTLNMDEFREGSGQPFIAIKALLNTLVVVPPLKEQRRIAGILGAFEDLIETNRQLADYLDELCTRKVAQALRESASVTRLAEVATFVNGRNFTKGADGTGRPVIRTPEVRSGPGDGTVWTTVEADEDRIARVGDILFVWSGTLMVNRWAYTEALVNQHVFKVLPNAVPGWYVYQLIEAQLPWFLGLAKDKATTMGHIQRAHLDEPQPGLDPEALWDLDSVIRPLWDAALGLRLQAIELTKHRDELLPLLISGKVRVSEVEATLP